MNIPPLESLLTDLDEARRQRNASNRKVEELTDALDNAGMIIERITAERDEAINYAKNNELYIVNLTAERDRFANMMYALREAKEALEVYREYTTEQTGVAEQAIANINKVLGEG